MLAALHRIDPDPHRLVELAVLLVASVSATVTRYVALRSWVFARRRPGPLRQAVAAIGRTVL